MYQIALFLLLISLCGSARAAHDNLENFSNNTKCRCLPTHPCWPSDKAWSDLASKLKGKLIKPEYPIAGCFENVNSKICQQQLVAIKSPYFLQSTPGASESQGWLGAWNGHASAYAVEAANSADIATAVNFAREHNLRIVIKGSGHDYLGRSTAPDSLLIWTHNMREMHYNKKFIPTGCSNVKPIQAITIGAGTRWIDVYDEVTTKRNRYAQGGGCATVGAAGGFIQGGGFGHFSKKFGTGAAGLVEAEIITADGKTLIANQCQNSDLFWGVRGGGGSTFGVVSKITLMTHELPKHFQIFEGKITAKDDHAYKTLITQFLKFFRDKLNNEHWGEQFTFKADNSIDIFMFSQDLTTEQSEAIWQPLKKWIATQPDLFTMKTKITQIPPEKFWDYRFWEKVNPNFIHKNTLEGAAKQEYWWAPTQGEVFEYWYTYQSRWIPQSLLAEDQLEKTTDVFFNASRFHPITFHVNKGLAGASAEAVQRSKDTSTNPDVYDAAALIIMGAGSNQVFPGVVGKEPNTATAKKTVENITRAMQIITAATPNTGTYVNEADYFQENWQQNFWGANYQRLLEIKNKYDPNGLFYCHHCVGSERWDGGGMCRLSKFK